LGLRGSVGIMHYTYILESESNGKYYIGTTDNIDRRLEEHNSGLNKSTKSGIPWKLKRLESFRIINQAYKREKFLKSRKSRKIINMVIEDI
jgi:putative endonuclease